MTESRGVLKGVCNLFSETGNEGGYWAFQDSSFITKNVPRPFCRKCGKYLDPQKHGSIIIERAWSLNQALSGEEPPDCPEGEHERDVGDSWSYEGLHILKDGDELTIFSPDNPTQVVWSGIIDLHQVLSFDEFASGFRIHTDQKGIDREAWARYFLDGYPAELISNRKSS